PLFYFFPISVTGLIADSVTIVERKTRVSSMIRLLLN
ncbi:MAG: hypothetical protein ACI9LO_003452, partial [Planctomycetota bacterium]